MKSLREIITNMSEEAKIAILVPTIIFGLCLAPLVIPCEKNFLIKRSCCPAGWENAPKYELKAYESENKQRQNIDHPNYEF